MKTSHVDEASFVEVFTSAQVWQIDTVRHALENAELPHFARQINPGGYSSAFQAMPTGMPGVSWVVLVPSTELDRAHSIIASLPVDRSGEPGFYGFTSPEVVSQWGSRKASLLLAVLVVAVATISIWRACSL